MLLFRAILSYSILSHLIASYRIHVCMHVCRLVTALWLRARTRISWMLFLYMFYSLGWFGMVRESACVRDRLRG